MRRNRTQVVFGAGLLLVSLVAGACSSDSTGGSGDGRSVTVQPDLAAQPFYVQVSVSDSGFDPPIVSIPAGRYVRLVIRNHGSGEHHYRVKGLIPAQLRWLEEPVIDTYDLDSMTPADLEELGLTDVTDQLEAEHVLHHIDPAFVPFKDAAPSGIKPIGTEVHGWVISGVTDTLTFYALNTGRFEVEDALNPEVTGTMVVFLPEDAKDGFLSG